MSGVNERFIEFWQVLMKFILNKCHSMGPILLDTFSKVTISNAAVLKTPTFKNSSHLSLPNNRCTKITKQVDFLEHLNSSEVTWHPEFVAHGIK